MAIVHGVGHGISGHQYKSVETLRLHDRPFDSLESADRTSDKRVDMADSECIGENAVGVHNVTDCIFREILEIWMPCSRIGVQWGCCPVRRPENIGTDHKVVCRIKEFTLLDRMRPPVLNIAVGGQGMAYPDDVAFIIVESAVCVICDTKFIELTSEFERERLVVVIIIDHFSN